MAQATCGSRYSKRAPKRTILAFISTQVRTFLKRDTAYTLGLTKVTARIPRGVPNGEYLVRVEHVALHKPGSPQFYVACGQVRVSGGGGGSPGPKVAFPGVYSKSSPSFTYNMYSGGM
jgi:hypothetical protein